MSEGGVRRAAAVRLLLALAAIALLIFAWHPWSGAPRTRAGRTEATSSPVTTEQPVTGDTEVARPDGEVEEEEGSGEEGEERAYRLTVVSRRDGSPIAGAKVSRGEACHGTTGADGVVEFRAGSYNWWRASAPGFFPVDLDFDGDGNGWAALPPATIVTGKVLDAATRRPIGGADIRLWAKDRWDDETAATDEAGRFEVAGALWQGYSLVVQADGYCPAEREGRLAGPLHDLEIVLAEAAILQGYVFDADGAPVERARVFLEAGEEAVPNLEAQSDAQGEYTIAGVPLGVKLVPWTENPRFSGDVVAFRDPGEVQRRDIRFLKLATLIVTVRDPGGKPVGLREVALEKWRLQGAGLVPAEYFFGDVPPGRYQLKVLPYGWPEHSREVVLAAGETREEIVLSGGLAIEGTVVALDRSPLLGHVRWSNGTQSGSANADAEGHFRIDGLPAAPTDLRVSAPDHAVATREGVMPGGPPVAIGLQPAARVTGRVVGHTRAHNLHAQIWSESSCGGYDIEDDGRFEFVIDHLGEPVILAFGRGLEVPVVLPLPPLAADEARDVGEIRFDVGRTVRGRVLGADAKPAVGALVDLVEFWSEEGGSTRTDESGRFCLLRVPKTPLWVRVDMERYPPHFFRVEEDTVELHLATGGVAEGRGEASFRPAGPSGWTAKATVEATPDEDGSYSVRLQPGHYRGWIEDEDGKTLDLVPFVIREGETTKVEITPR
jgi:protocatechuate 3,4-dioxygenase beta subunit